MPPHIAFGMGNHLGKEKFVILVGEVLGQRTRVTIDRWMKGGDFCHSSMMAFANQTENNAPLMPRHKACISANLLRPG